MKVSAQQPWQKWTVGFVWCPPPREAVFFQLAPTIAQNKFQAGLLSHDSKLESYPQGRTEHPFFNAEGLFIQITHMVWYYTTSSLPDRLLTAVELCCSNMQSIKQWKTSSGGLCCRVFQLKHHGLPVSFVDHTSTTPPNYIAKVEFPYMILQDNMII